MAGEADEDLSKILKMKIVRKSGKYVNTNSEEMMAKEWEKFLI